MKLSAVFFSVFYVLSLFIYFGAYGKASHEDSQFEDSLLTEKYIKRIFLKDPHRALELLDKAEIEAPASLPQYKIDLYRASAYNELRMFSLGEKYSRKVLESDSVALKPNIKLQAMSVCLRIIILF